MNRALINEINNLVHPPPERVFLFLSPYLTMKTGERHPWIHILHLEQIASLSKTLFRNPQLN